ncbi:imm11 family protein [Tabrizicola sp. M-4]|uniref:imm11 family protein n=1 Tax=Tabrizicola sp. M-4 TaxID=3055847 RepID=UPI003DA82888
MVWGIFFSSDFDAFSPKGAFRGYHAALAAHFNARQVPGLTPKHPPRYVFTDDRPLDGDGKPYEVFQIYVLHVSEKFHSELGENGYHRPPLLPIAAHEWPKEFVYDRTYARKAALMEGPNRMYFVAEPLREIIERLEPGVHHFNPIRVLLPKGEEHPVQHHMMVVGRWLSAFRLQESDPKSLWDTDSPSPSIGLPLKERCRGVAMSAEAIGSAHLWCERHLRRLTFCMSDRLQAEITAAGLHIPPHYRMRTSE